MQSSQLIPPAQLWIGPEQTVLAYTISYVQKIMCAHQGCGICSTCERIKHRQHPNVLWLQPEKQYTVDDLEGIFNTIALALNEDEHFFFILCKADALTPACAHRLLKSIEEPPRGYHFIVLAQNKDALLPTIRSRCIMQSWYADDDEPRSPLLKFFTQSHAYDPALFLKEIESSKITEQESVELLNYLIAHWTKRYKQALQNHHDAWGYKQQAEFFAHALEYPPMPGSSKLFWKNIFLQYAATSLKS